MISGHTLTLVATLISMVYCASAIVHCLMNPRLQNGAKLPWVLVILLMNFVGAALDFLFARNPDGGPPVVMLLWIALLLVPVLGMLVLFLTLFPWHR